MKAMSPVPQTWAGKISLSDTFLNPKTPHSLEEEVRFHGTLTSGTQLAMSTFVPHTLTQRRKRDATHFCS